MVQSKESLVQRLRTSLNWEVAVYALLILIALLMRLWAVEDRSFSHDESLHAVYSWYLFDGWDYNHDPMMHGPFQFFGNALIFAIFGDTDFTVRLLPAFFGTALVALPFFLRRQLGHWGAIAVATLITFSPLLLYYSRYVRNDIYILFWVLLLIVCIWRYFDERKARYLYIGAAALSFSFCTKEVAYITVGMIGLFLLFVAARELIGKTYQRFDLKNLSPASELLILIGTLSLPLYSAFIQLIPGVDLPEGVHWAKVLTVVILFLISAGIGFIWNWRRWLISALIFYSIFTLLYTTFFFNTSGFTSGLWSSVDYWVEQHDVARGGQPWFYYLVILPIYEFLPLTFAFIGGIYYAIKGSLFSRFLIYWTILSLILLSFAGEKMPWLSVHIAFPAILLGGMFIGRLLHALYTKEHRRWAIRVVTVMALLLLIPYSINVAVQENYQKSDDPPQMLLYAGMSWDIREAVDRIEELAKQRREGKDIRINVDSDLTWAFYWYLRDYKFVDYSNLGSISSPPEGTVLFIESGHESAAKPHLDKYGEGQRFDYLIWFPEEYRDFEFGWWLDYFLHRDTDGPYWSREGISYFPPDSS